MAEKKEYTPSEAVLAAQAAVEAQKNARPGEYRSGWESQMRELMDQILNRRDFHYNLNGDALYRQYRDRAMADGRLAMENTMGLAAALTGGYGNSYAQSVGQQAYWRQIEGLGDRIPELYALALKQYQQQAESLRQKYALLAGAEDRDYGRYQDALSAWQKEADLLQRNFTDARDFDYGAYRDQVKDWQWQEEFDESKRRYDQQWNAAHTAAQPTVYYSGAKKTTKKEEKKSTATPLSVLAVGALSKLKKDGVTRGV